MHIFSKFEEKCLKRLYTQANPYPIFLLLIPGGLIITSCDSLFISTARSHHGLSVIFLLLKLMSLASLSLRETREKISDSIEQILKDLFFTILFL